MKKAIASFVLVITLAGCGGGLGGAMSEIVRDQLARGPVIQGSR